MTLLICFHWFSFSSDDGYLVTNVVKSNCDVLHDKIKPLIQSTARTGFIDMHSLSGVFDLKASGYEDPYLVSGTDGVGTKLKVSTVIFQMRLLKLII